MQCIQAVKFSADHAASHLRPKSSRVGFIAAEMRAADRRGQDGSDVLCIPVDDATLQQILDDMDGQQ